jgi:mannose/fructose/sorbose-specific phosphotransferase system IIA component
MVQLIVSGHGGFAAGMADAVRLLWGEEDYISFIPYLESEGSELLKQKYLSAVDNTGGGSLFLVDLFGGTPYNVAAQVALGRRHVDILAGVSLPVIMEAISQAGAKPLAALAGYLKQCAADSALIFSEEVKKQEQQDDL